MNGYNNGEIGRSQRQLADALATTNFRAIGRGIAELMEHGFIDVTAEGQWKARQAREYRLTFVSTKTAGATNDYRAWVKPEKSCADTASTESRVAAQAVSPAARKLDDAASARIAAHRRKTAKSADGRC
ncbi:MAG: hypothetical protein V4513_00475 [Pseudomonadota bacterium]